jgi:phosphoribosylglycinamide formyltransferase 1
MLRLAVLISGRGSNLQALIAATATPDYPAAIKLVIANRPQAAGLDYAVAAGLPHCVIDHRQYENREAFEKALDVALTQAGIELVCLAGFMRVLTPWFVERWQGKLINIHPSLLPAFTGVDTHARVLKAGVRFTGCTTHYVWPEVDAGPIILQSVVPVLPKDTAETLAARVLEAEHKLFPATIRLIAENHVTIEDGLTVLA